MSRIQDGWFAFDNDLNSALDALAGTYVSSGGACTEKGTPNMSVDVAEIFYYVGGVKAHKVATNVVIGAAPGSGARKDIIVGDNAGNLSVVAGTPETVRPSGDSGPATFQPKPPNIPTDKVLIAEVWVVTGASAIYNADITDRRVIFAPLPECGALVYHNAAQTIPSGAWTVLSFNSEQFDTDGIHSLAPPTSRLTCKTAGKYPIGASIAFDAHSTGIRGVALRVGGATYISIQQSQALPAPFEHSVEVSHPGYDMAVEDYVEVLVYQSSGGALDVLRYADYSPEFGMSRIGAAGGTTPHAVEHQDGGPDEVDVTALSGLLSDDQHVLDAEVLAVAAALVHKTRHQNAGDDEISVAALSGELADPQPPKTHKASHQNAGGDEVSVAALSGLLADDQHVLDAEVLAVAAALVHKARHQNAGADEINVGGLSGELADLQPPKAHTLASHSTKAHTELTGVTASQHHAQTHKNTHKSGGADALTSADLLEAIVKRIRTTTGPTTLTVGAIAIGEYVKRDGATLIGGTPVGAGGLYSDYIHIRDEKANGTHGGGFTLGAWRRRDLTVELHDTGGDAALAANQITLEAGTYRCFISCPAYEVGANKARLQNITDASTIIVGTTEAAELATVGTADLGGTVRSIIVGRFTLAAQKVLEVQHYSSHTRAVAGFGYACGFGVIEVYTEVEFWKEA